jgi:hypothetical protein
MVFECPNPASILDRDNRRYRSAYLSWTLAFSIDIPRLYSAGYSSFDFGMARKNVAPPGSDGTSPYLNIVRERS